jgi:hypothetical protein
MITIKVSVDKLYDEFMNQLAREPEPKQAFAQAIHHLGWEYLIQVDQVILAGFPLGSMQASGKFRDYVYVTRNGKTYVRKYVIPVNRKTDKQQAHRRRFGNLAKSWAALSPEVQNYYKQLAKSERENGFNLFIQEQF